MPVDFSTWRRNARHGPKIRNIFQRAELTEQEIRILHGIVSGLMRRKLGVDEGESWVDKDPAIYTPPASGNEGHKATPPVVYGGTDYRNENNSG